MKKHILFISLIAAACCTLLSCEKESASTPVPPPAQTLTIDFGALPFAPSTKSGDDVDPGYNHSLTPITDIIFNIWQHIYKSIVNIPVGSFDAVLNVNPVEGGNGEWIWESSYKNFGQTYGVKLIGTDAGKKTDWELKISHDGLLGYNDYAWITGWSAKDGSEGEWYIKAGPRDTDVMLTSSWKAVGNEVQSVKLTYDLDHRHGTISEFFNGSYVEYSHSATDKAYDSSLDMHYGQNVIGLNVNALIEWNSKTGECRINCDKVFDDSSWHKWKK